MCVSGGGRGGGVWVEEEQAGEAEEAEGEVDEEEGEEEGEEAER